VDVGIPARRVPARLRPWLAAPFALETWAATGYLVLTLFVGTFWFAVLVTGVSVGLGLVIIWVGLPVLAATLLVARVGARAERALIRATLGVDIASPYRPPRRGSAWQHALALLTDPATWKDLVYLLLLMPLGVVWTVLVTVAWSIPIGLISAPAWYRVPPGAQASLFTVGDTPLVVIDTLGEALLALAAGLLLLAVVPPVVRALATGHAAIARGLLGPGGGALAERVQTLEATRARAMEASAVERRRIERDLHDGAQQRLVALAMDLGMAREKFATDPDAARSLVDEAHQEAKRALAELRDLARGIHPAVLTDRGLDAALSALAARSPVPVDVRVDLDRRPPESVESIAYFVVAEALTNVAKHAAATEATVRVGRGGGRVVVEVSDDGVGGADLHGGSGLTGLADRVAGVDGRLTVTSPPGGPTVVRAELPAAD